MLSDPFCFTGKASPAMIELENVIHRVEVLPGREIEALAGVTLTIGSGEYVALMGANGSGKSTLARHLNGLLLPSSGRVRVEGFDTADHSRLWEIRERVGLVFQNPDHQMVAPVVEEEIAFGPENLGLPVAEIRSRIDEALRAVDMEGYRGHNPGHLSGGQRQRIAIASVLAMRPRCIVLDEPTAMLDACGRREVLAVLRRLHQERGVAVVLVTHEMVEAAEASRLIVMQHGRIAADGPFAQTVGEPSDLVRLGLGLPAMVRVLHSFQQAGIPLPTPLPLAPAEAARAVVSAVRGAAPLPSGVEETDSASIGEPQVTLEHVSFRYMRGTPFETLALRDVSTQLCAGERVALVGSTGSGKSTLLAHLNGLLRPDAGRVCVGDEDLSSRRVDLRAVRQRVGMVFQRPEHQLFEETVEADVAYGPRNLGVSEAETAQRVRAALERVGLDPDAYSERSPLALSGGEMRRVALAGVLAMQPRVMVMDEPLAGLDAEGQDRLLGILATLHAEGVTTVVVTHDLERLSEVASRVIVMSDGRIASDGPLEAALGRGGGADLIEPPACTRLARALVEMGVGVDAAATRSDRLAQEVVRVLMNQDS